ncbi:hypothetical protein [Nonomuraea sp. NPDC050643]
MIGDYGENRRLRGASGGTVLDRPAIARSWTSSGRYRQRRRRTSAA